MYATLIKSLHNHSYGKGRKTSRGCAEVGQKKAFSLKIELESWPWSEYGTISIEFEGERADSTWTDARHMGSCLEPKRGKSVDTKKECNRSEKRDPENAQAGPEGMKKEMTRKNRAHSHVKEPEKGSCYPKAVCWG